MGSVPIVAKSYSVALIGCVHFSIYIYLYFFLCFLERGNSSKNVGLFLTFLWFMRLKLNKIKWYGHTIQCSYIKMNVNIISPFCENHKLSHICHQHQAVWVSLIGPDLLMYSIFANTAFIFASMVISTAFSQPEGPFCVARFPYVLRITKNTTGPQ